MHGPLARVELGHYRVEKVYFNLVFKNNGEVELTKQKQEDIISYTWSWDSWSFERKTNRRLEIILKHPERGTFTFYSYKHFAEWLNKPSSDYTSKEEQYLQSMDLATVDFAIPRIPIVGPSSEGALFRGTTEGWAGNPAYKQLRVTPASTDPGVATIFATEASNFGNGVVYIATKADLQGVSLSADANVLQTMEKEVAVGLLPFEFTKRASLSITANEARNILKGMGISIPRNIQKSQISEVLKEVPKLTDKQIEMFFKKAVEIASKKK